MGVALFAILFPISRMNYLLFHSLVEMAAALVAFGIFVIAWNTRSITPNSYLLALGVPQLFIGGVLLLHALAYKGMGVFPGYGANEATQLWIVARILAGCAFLAAGIAIRRPMRASRVFVAFGAAACLSLVAVFVWHDFPVMYLDGVGLTPIKIAAEYFVMLLAAVALWLLWRDRSRFEGRVFRLIAGAILTMIAAELAFTLYVDPTGTLNFFGHYLALLSLMMIYMAVIDTALVRPYSLLFFELKQREQSEHAIADTLQSAMLMAPGRVGAIEMGYAYVSSMGLARVGGDFYDLFKPANGFVSFVIGDVCGKGIEAAVSTTMVRATLRAFAYDDHDPTSVLDHTNDSLTDQFASDKFATVIFGTLESATGRLRIASAGHPDPVLCRADVASCIDLPRNPPLSVVRNQEFESVELCLEDGDTLILYTDGLLEAGWRADQFGTERLLLHAGESLGKEPSEIAEALMSAAQRYAGDRLDDDVAIVVLRYTTPADEGAAT